MRKKKSAEPEMGYYPFEHWLGRTRTARGRGRQAGVRRVQARGLCAPGHAGWAVGFALGALSLF